MITKPARHQTASIPSVAGEKDSTVRDTLSKLRRKFAVTDDAALVRVARERGLLAEVPRWWPTERWGGAMHYWDVRRLLRDIGRASDRWRLHDAWLASGPDDWRAVVDDGDTGLWHPLDAYVDLVAARPALPPGQPPAALLATLPPAHRAGALTWDELLTLADQVAGAGPPWRLARLVRADVVDTDWDRYGIFVLGGRGGRWIDRPADWERLRGGAPGGA